MAVNVGVASVASVEERVAAGAAWMDRTVPGWAARINTARLEMTSECDCILGQTFEGFWKFLHQTHMTYGDTEAMGFAAMTGGWKGFVEYEDLEDAWRRQIDRRRRAVTSSELP